MKARESHEELIRHLLKKTSRTSSIGSRAESRVLARIGEYTQKKAFRFNPFLSLSLNPSLSLILVIPLIAILSLTIALRITGAMDNALPEIVLASGSAIEMSENEAALQTGDRISPDTVVRIPEGSAGDFALSGKARFRFFPGSVFSLTVPSNSGKTVEIALSTGNLYISKTRALLDGKTLAVRTGDYTMELTGTRVHVQRFENLIRAFCYEGIVRVRLAGKNDGRDIYTLLAGECIAISSVNGKPHYDIDGFLDTAAVDFDRDCIEFPPFEAAFTARHSGFLTPYEGLPEADTNAECTHSVPVTSSDSVRQDTTEVAEPYTFRLIGTVNGDEFGGNTPAFVTGASDGMRGYILTSHDLFLVDERGLRKCGDFPSHTTFKVKPVVSEDSICLLSTRAVYLLDKSTFRVKGEYPLPESGSSEDNYHPAAAGKSLIVPVLNNGYYSLDLQSGRRGPVRFFIERFPVTPIVWEDGRMTVGASYENYLAMIDTDGTIDWKYRLEGISYVNPVKAGGRIVTYLGTHDSSSILILDRKGTPAGKWPLPAPVNSDMAVYKQLVCGYTTEGVLFSLDITTGRYTEIAAPYKSGFSNRTWRMMCPAVAGTRLVSGSAGGDVIVYDFEDGNIEYTGQIGNSESFYSSPIVFTDRVYLVSDSGNVYTVIKNDR
ncbi:MAG: FecR domain-containing protein [Spirochaetales bacterium]|nr:FecR domain-containing protein [Spirochaetales bacterium]